MAKRGDKRSAVLAAVVLGICSAAFLAGILSFEHVPLSGALSRLRQSPAPPLPPEFPDVTIVVIDVDSIQQSPELWPWPRDRFSELVVRLDAAGAKVIVINVDFSTRQARRADMKFAQTIKTSGHVVLAATSALQATEDSAVAERARLPAPEFRIGAAAVAHALLDPDSKGIVRHGLRRGHIDGQDYPSLAQAAVAVAMGENPVPLEVSAFPIDYRRVDPPIPIIPAAEVLSGSFDPGDVAGRIVLIGGTAERFDDRWKTPLGEQADGIYIQALATRTLLAERAYR